MITPNYILYFVHEVKVRGKLAIAELILIFFSTKKMLRIERMAAIGNAVNCICWPASVCLAMASDVALAKGAGDSCVVLGLFAALPRCSVVRKPGSA